MLLVSVVIWQSLTSFSTNSCVSTHFFPHIRVHSWCSASQDSSSDAAAESAIRSADLGELVDVLLCLPDEDEFPAVLSKALRAMERIQRPCIKILDRTKDATGEESNLTSAARQWLIAHVEMVEDILRESDMVSTSCRLGRSAKPVTGSVEGIL